jgi:hypothetical protein
MTKKVITIIILETYFGNRPPGFRRREIFDHVLEIRSSLLSKHASIGTIGVLCAVLRPYC